MARREIIKDQPRAPANKTLGSKFRLNCKRLFLTWPQCPVSRDDAVGQIKEKLKKSIIKRLVVGQEHHLDGELHLHAAIELERRCNICRANHFDLTLQADGPNGETKKYHGDYQKMKGSFHASASYCTKEDKEAVVEGVNLLALATATKSKKKYIAKEVFEGKPLAQAIKENPDCLFEHYSWKRSVCSYKLDAAKPYAPGGVRGLWFWGKPNTGKSHRAREISLKEFDQNPYVKDTTRWWDGYEGEKVVVLDDLDSSFAQMPGLTNRLKVWTDKYPVNGEIKGGTIPLEHEIFIVTSNHRPHEVWPKAEQRSDLAAVLSRFYLQEFT